MRTLLAVLALLLLTSSAFASGVYAPLDYYQDIGAACGAFPSVVWSFVGTADQFRWAAGWCQHSERGVVIVEYACDTIAGGRYLRFSTPPPYQFIDNFTKVAVRQPC